MRFDVFEDTYKRRQSSGEIFLFDPAGGSPLPEYSLGWTPLDGIKTLDDAMRRAQALSEGIDAGSLQSGDFWKAKAKDLIGPVLFAAALADLTMAQVIKWLSLDRFELVRAIETALSSHRSDSFDASHTGEPSDADVCVERLEALATSPENTYGSYAAVASTMVSVFGYREVERRCRRGGLEIERLLDGRAHTLYLCAPSAEQRLFRPLFTALTNEVLHLTIARNTASVPQDRVPMLICLDEAGNIARLEDLDVLATTAAGNNIQLVSIFHDMSQLRNAYGESRAAIIANNHSAMIFLPGSRDPATNDFLVDVLRDDSVRGLPHMGWNFADLRKLGERDSLCIYAGLPPAILSQRRWYETASLRGTPETIDHE